MRSRRARRGAILVFGSTILLVAAVGIGEEPSPDPWMLLGSLRDELTETPRRARFVQRYRPAGFSSEERESGQVFLDIPAAIRWDYEEPFPKSFLLRDETVFTWNPGDDTGRRYEIEEQEEPGLDLLRLRLEALRPRYDADARWVQASTFEVILRPREPSDLLAEARMVVDQRARRLDSLSYRDLEGNLTVFEIGDYRPLEADAVFDPPAEMEWLDQ